MIRPSGDMTGSEAHPADESIDAVMRKYDRESNVRAWKGWPKWAVSTFFALFSLYCIYMTLFSTTLPEIRLSLFLGMITIAGYLIFPLRKGVSKANHIPWYDIALLVAGSSCFFYHAANALPVIKLMGRINGMQIAIGIVGVLCLAELCRRCVGLPILVVAGCLLAYTFYNKLTFVETPFRIALRDIVFTLFYSTSGVLGTPVNVCYTYIALFIIFGAFLERTEIANFFISFANRIAGWSSGGPAKVAVISSALCGMVSGSSVGNTVTTGSITIPMMKRNGYRPEFAGAVEASSSTGGQLMPPIMGAAAFLMAEYIGIPYMQVALKAVIPAVLYFAGIFIAVHLEAKALGLKGIPSDSLPKWSQLLRVCYLTIPLFMLVILVATGARTMAFSAATSIVAAVLVGFVHFFAKRHGSGDGHAIDGAAKETVRASFDALVAGARGTVTVAVACAVAGIIAGCITTTGLASIVINATVKLAGNATAIGLVLTMVCCIILGMGVPTTANYCIMASTCAPILIQLGFHPVVAHFFVFYFGIVADITPPVALAAYAGSAIAKANPMHTGLNATKLAVAAFIVPYIFAYSPNMLLVGLDGGAVKIAFEISMLVITAIIGLFGVGVSLNGHLFRRVAPVARLLFAAAGLLMIHPGHFTDAIGFVCIVAMTMFQARR
ncbi:MAG: TRAP transporter fused permease subunit [Victivallales bacterium]|nr:TRAP transporter fused permease subunit [Victivallales bacterium]